MLKDHSTIYIFTDCKELITRNLEKYWLEDKEGCHGRMESKAGYPRTLSRTVAPKLPPPTAEVAEERKS